MRILAKTGLLLSVGFRIAGDATASPVVGIVNRPAAGPVEEPLQVEVP
jgi:hypothetical protein